MTHTEVRLEKNGTVIAYIGPDEDVIPNAKNDVKGGPRPGNRSSIHRDQQLIVHEVTVQAVFESSANLPDEHKTALETLFGTSPVSAQQQMWRVMRFMEETGGPFEFYVRDTEYAYTGGNVDRDNGKFPTVQINQFQPRLKPGLERIEYTLKMLAGEER